MKFSIKLHLVVLVLTAIDLSHLCFFLRLLTAAPVVVVVTTIATILYLKLPKKRTKIFSATLVHTLQTEERREKEEKGREERQKKEVRFSSSSLQFFELLKL